MMIQDDGNADTYRVVCWCGGKARVRKDDPDVVEQMATQA